MHSTKRLLYTTSLFALVLSIPFLFSSCATLFSGGSQDVEIQSTPSNADVLVEGSKRGTTPAEIEITRPEQGEAPEITIQKEGYEAKTLSLQKSFNAVTLLNILNPFSYFPLGLPATGFVVDWVTGALWDYDPEGYTVELASGNASSMAPTPYKDRGSHSTAPSKIERYNLKNLPTDEDGHRLVPAHEHAVSIYDPDTGTVYRFQ